MWRLLKMTMDVYEVVKSAKQKSEKEVVFSTLNPVEAERVAFQYKVNQSLAEKEEIEFQWQGHPTFRFQFIIGQGSFRR
jgi:hypothetical protein